MSVNDKPLKARISTRQAFDSLKFNIIGKEPSLLSRLNEITPNQRLDVVGNEVDDDDGSLPMDIDEDSSNEMEVELPLLQRLSGATPKAATSKDATKLPPSPPSPNQASGSKSAPGVRLGDSPLKAPTDATSSATEPRKLEATAVNTTAPLPSPPLTASGTSSLDASMELPAAENISPPKVTNKPSTEATPGIRMPFPFRRPTTPSVSLKLAVAVAEIQRIEAEKVAAEKAVLDLIMEEKCAWEDVRSTRNVERHREELLKWHQMQQLAISSPLTPVPQDDPMPSLTSIPPVSVGNSASSSAASHVTRNEEESSTSNRPSQVSASPSTQNTEELGAKEAASSRKDGLTRAMIAEKSRLEEPQLRRASPSPIPGLTMSNASDACQTEVTPSVCRFDSASAPNVSNTEPQQQSAAPSTASSSSSVIAPQKEEQVPSDDQEKIMGEKPFLTSNAAPQLPGQLAPVDPQISSVQLPKLQTSPDDKEMALHHTDSKNTPSPVEREHQLRNRVRERTVSDKDTGERTSAPAPSVDTSLRAQTRRSHDGAGRVVSGGAPVVAVPRRSNLSVPPAPDSARIPGLPHKPTSSPTPPSAAPLTAVIPNGSIEPAGLRSTLPPSDEHKPASSSALKRKRSSSPSVNFKDEPAEEKPFVSGALLGARNVKRKKEETPTVSFTKQELDEQKSQAALGDALAASISNEVAQRLSIAPPVSNEGPVVHPATMQAVRNVSHPTTTDPRRVDHSRAAPAEAVSTSTAPLMNPAVIRQSDERDVDMGPDMRQRERTLSLEGRDAMTRTAPYSPRRQRSTSDRGGRNENAFSRRNSTRSFGSSHSRSPRMERREVGSTLR